ncbi:PP2C family protein-serine/threonine phosphatase [Pseudomonas sp. O230]|uniref:PP2C family protein-serine/threonine phosphatase n=1 Tax=Pseudomonas sp. O230 TaxID=3159450 RepID=UPI00387B39B1
MKYEAVSFSKAGRSKPNEDSTLIKELGDSAIVLAVADGMGGKPGGAIASKTAVEVISSLVDKDFGISVESLFEEVKKNLALKGDEMKELREMATTLSLVFIKDKQAVVGHVGDCRIYHLRANGLVSRTKDQTEVQRLIDDGILSKQRAQNYHRKNILLSVMNAADDYTLQLDSFGLESGDRLVLLTDGAHSLIQKNEMRDISVNAKSMTNFISEIKNTIESRKIRDDYSVVACEVK